MDNSRTVKRINKVKGMIELSDSAGRRLWHDIDKKLLESVCVDQDVEIEFKGSRVIRISPKDSRDRTRKLTKSSQIYDQGKNSKEKEDVRQDSSGRLLRSEKGAAPTSSTKNPYQFVRVVAQWPGKEELHTHVLGRRPPFKLDDLSEEKTGVIECTLTAKTPLFVGGYVDKDSSDVSRREFFNEGGARKIPGSTLRGMIRSVYEAATNSCVSGTRNHQHYFYRDRSRLTVIPGIIREKQGAIVFHPLSGDPPSDRPVEKRQPAAWIPRYLTNGQRRVNVPREMKLEHGRKYWAEIESLDYKSGIRIWNTIAILPLTKDQPRATKAGSLIVEAYYYCTGKNIHNKHDERIFFEGNMQSDIEISNDSEIKRRYESLLKDYKSRGKSSEGGQGNIKQSAFIEPSNSDWDLKDGCLLYGVYEGDSLVDLVPVLIPRRRFSSSNFDRIPDLVRPCTDIRYLCPACRMFGWVNASPSAKEEGDGDANKQAVAYRGRVRVSDATPSKDNGTHEDLHVLQGVPKPSAYGFYLRPRGSLDTDGDKASNSVSGKGYDDDRLQIRGRKMYLHHDRVDIKIGPHRDADQSNNKNMEKTLSGAYVDGSIFTFRISFERLSDVELGALLWVLTLPSSSDAGREMYHRLGYAKPLGLGSCRIDVKLLLESTAVYGSWDVEKGETSDSCDVFIKQFTAELIKVYGEGNAQSGNLTDVPFIGDMHNILGSKKDIGYPPLGEFGDRIKRKNSAEAVWGKEGYQHSEVLWLPLVEKDR